MAYLRQKKSDVNSVVRYTGNCFQFATGTDRGGDRPNMITTKYNKEDFTAAILAAGGIAITSGDLFKQYKEYETNYFLVAAMLKGVNEFHFVRMGCLDTGVDGWIGKWSKVEISYTIDYKNPIETSDFSTVNAQLLTKKNGNKYSSVGYFVFAVPKD